MLEITDTNKWVSIGTVGVWDGLLVDPESCTQIHMDFGLNEDGPPRWSSSMVYYDKKFIANLKANTPWHLTIPKTDSSLP